MDDVFYDLEEAGETPTASGMRTTGPGTTSYRDTLQWNNPNISSNVVQNSHWEDDGVGFEAISDDDEPPVEDDPTCPTIMLTKEENGNCDIHGRMLLLSECSTKALAICNLTEVLKRNGR